MNSTDIGSLLEEELVMRHEHVHEMLALKEDSALIEELRLLHDEARIRWLENFCSEYNENHDETGRFSSGGGSGGGGSGSSAGSGPEGASARVSYKPYDGLTDKQRSVETKFASQLRDQKAFVKYAEIKDTEGGRVVDLDAARELSSDYSASAENRMAYTLATHEPASAFVKEYIDAKLGEPANGSVLFMAGGAGSGKSSIRRGLMKDSDAGADLIIDSTFSGEKSATTNIEKALSSGRPVEIAYVHRPFESSVHSVEQRAKGSGRWVPPEVVAQNHVMAQETFLKLSDKYKGNPRVTFRAFSNPDVKPGNMVRPIEITLDTLRSMRYTKRGNRPFSQESADEAIARLTAMARKGLGDVETRARKLAESSVKVGAGGASHQDGQGAHRLDEEGHQTTDPGAGREAPVTPVLGEPRRMDFHPRKIKPDSRGGCGD